MHYISSTNFTRFLENLTNAYEVYVPVKKGDQRFYKKYAAGLEDIVVGEVRTAEPLKAFLSRAREVVAEDYKPDVPQPHAKPACIVGVKACDLKSLKIQDHVFKDSDIEDPFYQRLRESNLIISADCTSTIDTCFCLALGIQPYPQESFDINLSKVNDGFLVEEGSAKGTELIKDAAVLFEPVSDEYIKERAEQRARVSQDVEENIERHNVPHQDAFDCVVQNNFASDIWKEEAATCVECGACNVICPTCHCFLLYDQKNEENLKRLRIWDSCMVKDFARVAGGANPRARLWMRLRNRFEKKFDFFPKITNIYACTGCGRCISACPGKIDIRKVLKRLVSGV